MSLLRTGSARLLATSAVVLLAAGSSPSPAAAQVRGDPVCMTNMTSGSPKGDRAFTIILAPSRVEQFATRGFTVVPCNGKERHLPLVLDKMCALAARPDDLGTGAFKSVYGVSAKEICELAEEVAGSR